MTESNRADIDRLVIALVEQIARDLHGEIEDPVTPDTRLIADLGFASLDFVRLIVDIEERLQRKVGFHDLLMPNGRYVGDLAISRFTDFILSRESPAPGAPETPAATGTETPVTPAEQALAASRLTELTLAAFRSLMPSPERWGVTAPSLTGPKLPRAAFLLSSPRSGSTLLRVMLAGNPALFAPPELHLLNYTTLTQRRNALDNPANRHLMSGTVRAMVQLKGISIEEAEALHASQERQGVSTLDFYRQMQSWLGDRLLVDKTPIYTFHREILQRAEREFDQPLYIHLVRHPGGMIKSFEDAKIDQLIPFLRESSYSRRQIAELVWLLNQKNVDDFFRDVAAHRRLLVRYEELVNHTEKVVRDICQFLGVPYAAAMLDPYQGTEQRMADGLHTVAEFSGDLKFHLFDRIEPGAAERWRHHGQSESLSTMTTTLAERLGYKAEEAG